MKTEITIYLIIHQKDKTAHSVYRNPARISHSICKLAFFPLFSFHFIYILWLRFWFVVGFHSGIVWVWVNLSLLSVRVLLCTTTYSQLKQKQETNINKNKKPERCRVYSLLLFVRSLLLLWLILSSSSSPLLLFSFQ